MERRGEQKKDQKYCTIICEPVHYDFYTNSSRYYCTRATSNFTALGPQIFVSRAARSPYAKQSEPAPDSDVHRVMRSAANLTFEIRITRSDFSPQASCTSLKRLLLIVLAYFCFFQSPISSQKFFALAFDYPPVLHFCSALLDSLISQDCTYTNNHMDEDDKSNIPNDT